MKVLVTGANGFVGKRLMEYDKEKYELLPVSLRAQKASEIDLNEVEVIVHLAGKAHEMKEIDDNIYYQVNYELTKQLADHAVLAGVRQFIYISSVKVYGDEVGQVLDENSACLPTDAYGLSKLKAEEYLLSIQSDSFRVAIIRPPLVYGPGVKGNMIRILQLADRNYPLPFGGSNNQRSMVFVDNLIELINQVVNKQASGIFIAGDKAPLSTEDLIRQIRLALKREPGLIRVPGALKLLLKQFKPSLFKRLFGSFVIDNKNTNQALNFTPPFSTEFGIAQMVSWYKQQSA